MVNSHGQRRGTKAAIILACLAVVSVVAVAVIARSHYTAALRKFEVEHAKLQKQLEARNLMVADLQRQIRNLRAVVAASSMPKVGTRRASSSETELGLRRQLAELAASQSNTLAAIESLKAGVADSAASAEARTANQTALAALEASANEAQENVDAAHQKTEQLLQAMNVPPEIFAVETTTALANPNLQGYWPYFEAKRDEENLQRIAEALRLRLLQETVDSGVDATPANPP